MGGIEKYMHMGDMGSKRGAFYVRLGIGKERAPKLVDITRTRKSHSEMAGMWMEKFPSYKAGVRRCRRW